MTITGVFGQIGAGKSWYQLKYGLEMAEQRKKRLVTNFGLDFKALERYASKNKLPWVQWLAQNKQIAVIDTAQQLQDLLIYPRSVVLMDEAGIFLNTREFKNTPKKLLMDLAQSRKDGQDLIYAAQFDEQVDRQFRDLTQFCVHAAGKSRYCSKLKGPRLHWKIYHCFTADNYNQWKHNFRVRSNHFATGRLTFQCEMGPFTKRDASLFEVFDSFARLEQQAAAVSTMAKELPQDLRQTIADSKKAAGEMRRLQQIRSDYNALFAADIRDVLRAFRYAG